MTIRSLLQIIAATMFLALAALSAPGQNTDKTDKLGVPGPINFEGQDYALASSSHPQPNYFKQEYLACRPRT